MKKNNITTIIQFIIFLPISIWATINYGVNGLIVTSLVSYLLVTIGYFSLIIINKFKIELKSTRVFFIELGFVLIASFIIIMLFDHSEIKSWLKFITYCLCFTISYVFILYVLSIKFRNVLVSFAYSGCKKINKFKVR